MAKIDEVRGELPDLAHVVIIDGAADGAVPMAERGQPRRRAATTPSSNGAPRRSAPTTPA